jgi:hypothetical protein
MGNNWFQPRAISSSTMTIAEASLSPCGYSRLIFCLYHIRPLAMVLYCRFQKWKSLLESSYHHHLGNLKISPVRERLFNSGHVSFHSPSLFAVLWVRTSSEYRSQSLKISDSRSLSTRALRHLTLILERRRVRARS